MFNNRRIGELDESISQLKKDVWRLRDTQVALLEYLGLEAQVLRMPDLWVVVRKKKEGPRVQRKKAE